MNLEQDNTTKCQEKTTHLKFMQEALLEAQKAFHKGEVPVGAVIVKDGDIIARAHNLRHTQKRVEGHAEMLAMIEAANILGDWRLEGCDLYVTLEPCPMCAGALIQSRMQSLYFGAKDLKAGAIESKLQLLDIPFNHQIKVCGGIMEGESKALLQTFFKQLR
jgi:tRNA(adenine34) deaminase